MKSMNIGWAAVLYVAAVAALYRSRISGQSSQSLPAYETGLDYSAGRSSFSRSVSASPAAPGILQSGY